MRLRDIVGRRVNRARCLYRYSRRWRCGVISIAWFLIATGHRCRDQKDDNEVLDFHARSSIPYWLPEVVDLDQSDTGPVVFAGDNRGVGPRSQLGSEDA